MDMNKEREAFEQHYHQTHSPIICRPYPVLENGDYKYIEIDKAWKLWKVAKSQVPEGFVLVPKEPTEEMMVSVRDFWPSIQVYEEMSKDDWEHHYGDAYKTMIEAAQGEEE